MKKSLLGLLAIVLFGATSIIAQVVKVPPGCIIQFAGTNGNIGSGLVGNGGIITMPDPSGGGKFTFARPVGSTLSSPPTWILSGDLSTIRTSPAYNAAIQIATDTSTTIFTYNKFKRLSEDTLARSKGVVRVSYNTVANSTSPCPSSGSISFDVFKTYTTRLPSIVGPDCVMAGVRCTFSVDQVASDNIADVSPDNYYWSGMPPVAQPDSTYYSADKSSITFIPAGTGTLTLPFTIKCCIGRANPWNGGTNGSQATTGTACVTKTVGAAPTEPTFSSLTPATPLSTTVPACVPTGTASFTVNYTSFNTCTWNMGITGWTINTQTANATTGAQSITINTNGFNNPGQITLTVSNGSCTPLNFQYQINRSFAAPLAIVPVAPAGNCLELGSSNLFNVGATALLNATTWVLTSVPAVAGLPSWLSTQSPTSTVAVNVPANAPVNAVYTLRATGCGSSSIAYNFNVRPKKPTISGLACMTNGALAPQTYNCVASTGATYTWSFPQGWSAPNLTTSTNSITVTPTSNTATLNGTVTVTANGTVGCKDSASFKINYNSVAPTNIVANCWSVGIAGSVSVTITNPQTTGTYTATLNLVGGANVITNAPVSLSGSTLSFNTPALAAGNYNLIITYNNGNGCSEGIGVKIVTVAGNGYSIATLFTPLPVVGTSDRYTAVPLNGAPPVLFTQYQWFVNGAAVVGNNSPTLVLSGPTAPPAPSQVCVDVFSLGSTCKTRVCVAQGTHSMIANPGQGTKTESIKGLTIYPNPNTGNFTVNVDDMATSGSAVLYNVSGNEIGTYKLQKGENKIKNDNLAKGTYFILLTIDDKTDTRQIIIN